MNDETRNDTPERNDVRVGDWFRWVGPIHEEWGDAVAVRQIDASDLWIAESVGSKWNFMLANPRWWRRISPAPAAPKERVLAKGWVRGHVPYCTMRRLEGSPCKDDRHEADYSHSNTGDGCCEASAQAMGVFADIAIVPPPRDRQCALCRRTRNTGCTCVGTGAPTEAAPKGQTLREALESERLARTAQPPSPPRPLAFDEASPRPGKCEACRHDNGPECRALTFGRQLNVTSPCPCMCHPAETKRAPKVVGQYDDCFGCFTEATGPGLIEERGSWSAMQLGRAPGIDREPKPRTIDVRGVRPEYLESLDPDFVGLLDVSVRR